MLRFFNDNLNNNKLQHIRLHLAAYIKGAPADGQTDWLSGRWPAGTDQLFGRQTAKTDRLSGRRLGDRPAMDRPARPISGPP